MSFRSHLRTSYYATTIEEQVGPLFLWSDLYGPAPTDVMLVIDQRVLLDIDALVHGLEVEGDGELIFDPDSSRLLQVDQQRPVCVMEGGHLEMVPASPSIVHEIRFVDVDESLYTVGGGMNHTANPGLCVENATVTLQGAAKTSWTRTTAALSTGATSCTVADASGWRIGDDIVITPTEASTVANNWRHFDRRTLTNVVGNLLQFAATTYPHPSNTTPAGTVIYPEVVNLTRNVVIGGQDFSHRAQIMFMEDCTGSILEYFEGRFLGPRKIQEGSVLSQPVSGRYALHFHLMANGSRDLNVTGVSLHDLGHRGYVPHGSHGMTFTDCVLWGFSDAGMWWDATGEAPSTSDTYDLLIDRMFLGWGQVLGQSSLSIGMTAFHLGAGLNMVMRNCCAAAMDGTTNVSGYSWPADLNFNLRNVWTFEDNDAHNNDEMGIFIWQNDFNLHNIVRFRGWNNSRTGIQAGAYINVYHYTDNELWGNGASSPNDYHLSATSGGDEFGSRNIEVNGGHINAFRTDEHQVDSGTTHVNNCAINSLIVGDENEAGPGSRVDFVECGLHPDDMTILTHMNDESVWRIQTGASAWQITSTDGTTKIVTPIAPFYAGVGLSDLGIPMSNDAFACNVWDLHTFGGKVFIGYGDTGDNAGPITIYSLDPTTETFTAEYSAASEEIGKFRELDGKLHAPDFDQRGGAGGFYRRDAGVWSRQATIGAAIHCYDMVEFGGAFFAVIGSSTGDDVFQRSTNLGATWSDVCTPDAFEQFHGRAYHLFTLNGVLYATHEGRFNGDSLIYQWNGTAFVYTSNLLTTIMPSFTNPAIRMPRAVEFNSLLVYVGAAQTSESAHWAPFGLYRCGAGLASPAKITSVPTPYDLLVRNGVCYVCTYNGTQIGVWYSSDAVTWTEFFSFTSSTFARSFEELNGVWYFGLGTEGAHADSGKILSYAP